MLFSKFSPLPLLAVSGFSGSGKTSFIEKFIHALKRRGYFPGYVKHAAGKYRLDVPGKDSSRQLDAGASFSVVLTDEKWAMHQHGPLDTTTLGSHPQTDILLLEGFKKSVHPKVVCVHPEKSVPHELAWDNPGADRTLVWAYLTPDERLSKEINSTLGQSLAFRRDAVQPITEHLLTRMKEHYLQKFPLKGAVMMGGQSTRMGKDKAWLDYGKGPHAIYLFDLLSGASAIKEVVYSGKPLSPPPRSIAPETILCDRFLNFGPLGGILTLFENDPNAAWLILACDLVDLQPETIQYLIQNRNPLKSATVFVNHKNRYEPLVSIYEPHIGLQLKRALLGCEQSFQKIFPKMSIQKLQVPSNLETQFHNINSMEERQRTLQLQNAEKRFSGGRRDV